MDRYETLAIENSHIIKHRSGSNFGEIVTWEVGYTLTKKCCVVSVLSVYCQSITSVLPVWCQSIVRSDNRLVTYYQCETSVLSAYCQLWQHTGEMKIEKVAVIILIFHLKKTLAIDWRDKNIWQNTKITLDFELTSVLSDLVIEG